MIIKPSKRNTNKHTEKGMQLLETSIDKVGVIESISVTQEGTIISGRIIKGFENYFITKCGKVYNTFYCRRNEVKIMKSQIDRNGYEYVKLTNKTKQQKLKIHRLVAESYIENKENKPTVNHINGIKKDNRLENLEWSTWGENQKHALDNGLKIPKKGESHPMVKLNKEIVLEIFNSKEKSKYFQDKYNISQSKVSAIRNKKTWRHLFV
jgi:hypothetical protein